MQQESHHEKIADGSL